VVFPLSMWAEIPMFLSFEKSVYTSYLHLRGGPTTMVVSMRGALARPYGGPAWAPLVDRSRRLHPLAPGRRVPKHAPSIDIPTAPRGRNLAHRAA
jgi:hypothetical protein